MIPLSDDNPTQRKPYVVYLLILLNVLVYLVDISGPRTAFGGRLRNYSMVPRSVVQNVPTTWIAEGPVQLPDGRVVIERISEEHTGLTPQWLTIFTSMFMHAGFWHLAMNMLFLWIFGNNIEDVLGRSKFLVFYLICGVFAAAAHIMVNVNSEIPTVGASGAIAGVLGAYLVLYPAARINTLVLMGFFWTVVQLPAVLLLGVWFVLQLIGLPGSTLAGGGVAYGAHVGGFVAGAVIILLLGGKRLTRQQRMRPYDDRPYPWRRY